MHFHIMCSVKKNRKHVQYSSNSHNFKLKSLELFFIMPDLVKNCEEDVAACACLIWKKRPLKMHSYMTCVYTSYYHYCYYY